MSDPILTREQFAYAIKQAPAGLSKEEFAAYLDKEAKRVNAGKEYGGDITLGQDILEHKGVDTTQPPSPMMEALQHLAHPSTAGDFAGLLIPSGVAEAARPAARMAGSAYKYGKEALMGEGGGLKKAAGGAMKGLVNEAFPPNPNILQGARQFAPHEIPPRMSPAAQPAAIAPVDIPAGPEVLHGAAINEPGAIPPRLSPAAQAPARAAFRIPGPAADVLQGSEMFKPGNIPPRAAEAFGHDINPEPLQFGEHAEIMRNDYGPGALSSSTAPHIQIEPSEALSGLSNSPEVLSDLEKRMMKRPPSSPSAPIKEPVSAQAPEPVLKKTKSSSARGNTHSPNDLQVRVKLARLHPEWTADELDAGVMAERAGRNAQYQLGGQG